MATVAGGEDELVAYEDPFTVSPLEGPLEPGEGVHVAALFKLMALARW